MSSKAALIAGTGEMWVRRHIFGIWCWAWRHDMQKVKRRERISGAHGYWFRRTIHHLVVCSRCARVQRVEVKRGS